MPFSRHLLATLLFPALFISSQTRAQQQANDLAFQRAQHLRRGINTSEWFAQSSDYSVQRLRTFTTADDIRLIHHLGFDHIRISIDVDPLLAWQRKQDNGIAFVGELDAIVKLAIQEKLAVIIDIHPQSRYKQSLLQGEEPVQRFAMLWRSLATHFASFDPDYVFFEIMNEPEQALGLITEPSARQ
jgi:endoglucanase